MARRTRRRPSRANGSRLAADDDAVNPETWTASPRRRPRSTSEPAAMQRPPTLRPAVRRASASVACGAHRVRGTVAAGRADRRVDRCCLSAARALHLAFGEPRAAGRRQGARQDHATGDAACEPAKGVEGRRAIVLISAPLARPNGRADRPLQRRSIGLVFGPARGVASPPTARPPSSRSSITSRCWEMPTTSTRS